MWREPDHPIDPLYAQRWSPRSFTGEPVPDTVLRSAFEAARWAPSAMNAQPWRFVVAMPGQTSWEPLVGVLAPRNARWAAKASALVVILSYRFVERGGERVESGSNSFDAGAAWANFAHQALQLGWHTHGIGGFNRAAARELLAVPDDFAIEAIIALGQQGGLDLLHEDFHATERPNTRRPITETVFAGTFGHPAFEKERDAA